MMREQKQTAGRPGLSGRLPLDAGERKKVFIVAGLAAVCAIVVLVQLWKRKGPATAQAAAPLASAVDLDAVVAQMQRVVNPAPAGDEGPVIFTTVDEALDVFLGGTRPVAVPAEKLRSHVFGLPESVGAAPQSEADRLAASLADLKAADGTDPLAAELEMLSLETVLVSARNRTAIINGEVLHSGETIGGFKIESIEADRVTLSRDGKRFFLTLE